MRVSPVVEEAVSPLTTHQRKIARKQPGSSWKRLTKEVAYTTALVNKNDSLCQESIEEYRNQRYYSVCKPREWNPNDVSAFTNRFTTSIPRLKAKLLCCTLVSIWAWTAALVKLLVASKLRDEISRWFVWWGLAQRRLVIPTQARFLIKLRSKKPSS